MKETKNSLMGGWGVTEIRKPLMGGGKIIKVTCQVAAAGVGGVIKVTTIALYYHNCDKNIVLQ